MALDFNNKVENGGSTAEGRLSAAEFNELVDAVIANQDAIEALNDGKVGYASITTNATTHKTTISLYSEQGGSLIANVVVASQDLFSQLTNEITRATSAESSLSARIDGITTDVGVTSVTATTSNHITTLKFYKNSTLVQTVSAASSDVYSYISAEVTRATQAETSLGQYINQQISTVTSAAQAQALRITALENSIGEKFDSVELTTNNHEATIKFYADGLLKYSISVASRDLYSLLSQEINRAQNAETAIQNSLASIVQNVTALQQNAIQFYSFTGEGWEVYFIDDSVVEIWLNTVTRLGNFYGVITDTGHPYLQSCNASGQTTGKYLQCTHGGTWEETTNPTLVTNLNAERVVEKHFLLPTDEGANKVCILAHDYQGLSKGTAFLSYIDSTGACKWNAYPTLNDLQAGLNSKQATLVSGTNIKTINHQSLLGSGNITVSSEDGGSYVDVQVTGEDLEILPTNNKVGDIEDLTTQSKEDLVSAINEVNETKQATLVSGVNIKTINNQTLLGSGNIVIQGGSGGGSSYVEAIVIGENLQINPTDNWVGDITELTTSTKESVVKAVNEVNGIAKGAYARLVLKEDCMYIESKQQITSVEFLRCAKCNGHDNGYYAYKKGFLKAVNNRYYITSNHTSYRTLTLGLQRMVGDYSAPYVYKVLLNLSGTGVTTITNGDFNVQNLMKTFDNVENTFVRIRHSHKYKALTMVGSFGQKAECFKYALRCNNTILMPFQVLFDRKHTAISEYDNQGHHFEQPYFSLRDYWKFCVIKV